MGISKDRFGRFLRAAVVSGALGAAGLVVAAGPVHAQASDPSDPSDPAEPSDPSDPSDPSGTTGGTDGGTTDVGATTTGGVGGSGTLPSTGMDSSVFLLAGAGAGAGVLALRKVANRT